MPGDVVVVVVVVAVVAAATTVEGADAAPATPPVAVDPGVRTTGLGVTGALPSFCARFVVLPRPRSLPMSPPPGVPGVTPPPFPTAVSLLSVLVFALPPAAVVVPLSSSVGTGTGTGTGTGAGTGVAPATPFDTDGRRMGAVK